MYVFVLICHIGNLHNDLIILDIVTNTKVIYKYVLMLKIQLNLLHDRMTGWWYCVIAATPGSTPFATEYAIHETFLQTIHA